MPFSPRRGPVVPRRPSRWSPPGLPVLAWRYRLPPSPLPPVSPATVTGVGCLSSRCGTGPAGGGGEGVLLACILAIFAISPSSLPRRSESASVEESKLAARHGDERSLQHQAGRGGRLHLLHRFAQRYYEVEGSGPVSASPACLRMASKAASSTSRSSGLRSACCSRKTRRKCSWASRANWTRSLPSS